MPRLDPGDTPRGRTRGNYMGKYAGPATGSAAMAMGAMGTAIRKGIESMAAPVSQGGRNTRWDKDPRVVAKQKQRMRRGETSYIGGGTPGYR